jgi:anti-sigma regulatory factor (Ser/Thr protein kinase)
MSCRDVAVRQPSFEKEENMMKKRFNPITDRSSEIVAFLMASPDMPKDEDLRFKIELSIEEAVENVVQYAYEGGIGWLEAGTSLDDKSLILTIELRDAGMPFNPLEKDDPDITLSAGERPVGGLGIYICKSMMDSISYRYEDGNNVLVMSKRV